MGQVNDRTYTIAGVTYINHHGLPKNKKERIHFKVNKANKHDGMLLQLLDDRHLFLGVSYEGEKIPIGDALLFNWKGEATQGTSSYFFDVATLDWIKVKQQTEWDKTKEMTLIVIDKSIGQQRGGASKEEIELGQSGPEENDDDIVDVEEEEDEEYDV